MEIIAIVVGAALGLFAPPFLDRAFARHFEPENPDITWPRTFAVSAVAFVGGAILSVPVVYVPSTLGRVALCLVIAVAVRGNALKRIYRMETSAAFGCAVLVVFSVIAGALGIGLAVAACMAWPIASGVVVAVASVAFYAVRRRDVLTRRAFDAV